VTIVTADTNVYVSGLAFGGVPLQFLNHARAGAFRLAISAAILGEIRRVLGDKFLWQQDALDGVSAQLARFTLLVQPTQAIAAIKDDPDDDRILECAVEAGSDFIVSGDNHLLRLGSYSGIRILKVANFMLLLPTL